ncbi:protein Networked (NET), actin-binding (NAB) domain-containing protein [Artemisia annua]|uniref:Protein Networked (NET), actin-binding (NAB) domain-containing protein n=1 Tax=Artemisia annua TaxID=35608 RepID=A0A2U1M1E6_ARTAN|nr:protein Networked (NET), actin-binding (NAB) domain-containing protein [Artemisia annua]
MAKLTNRGVNKRFLMSEMDQSVKRMLELINEEGDSFAKRVEIYIQKRPQLVAQVQEFYRMFKSLSERYEKATSELRRAETSRPPDARSHRSSYSITEGCSEPPSTITSPERPVTRRLSECQTIFDVLGNRESYEASTLDSGSDSDDSVFNHYSSSSNNGNCQRRLRKKVAELEAELKRVRIEQEVNRSKSGIAKYKEELRVAREKIQSYELEIDQLKSKVEKYESMGLDEYYSSSEQSNRIYALEEKLGGAEEEVIKLRQELDPNGSDGADNEDIIMEDETEQLKLERDEFKVQPEAMWVLVIKVIHGLVGNLDRDVNVEENKEVSICDKVHNGLLHGFRRLPGGAEDVQMEESDGEFKVCSARHFIDEGLCDMEEMHTRWVKLIPIKVNIFAWRLASNKLPTRFNMSTRGLEIPSMVCLVCNEKVESSEHLFFSCSVASSITAKVLGWWGILDSGISSYQGWVIWLKGLRLRKEVKE